MAERTGRAAQAAAASGAPPEVERVVRRTGTSLLEDVRALVPLLRANQARTERERRVVTENIEALTDVGVFRMTVPRRFGGYESSVREQCDVLVEISRGCPSTGWVATILTAMIWNAALFSDDAQDEVFSDPHVRVASVFAAGGHALPVECGVRVSGRWPFNTGCHHAQWAILTALVPKSAAEPTPVSVLIPYRELEILDDWEPVGMAGTGSNTTIAEDVFVPEHRILSHARQLWYDLPTVNAGNPYFCVPAPTFAVGQAAGAPAGIARGALDAFMERLPGRKLRYTAAGTQSESPVTHVLLGETAMKVESAEGHARRAAELIDEFAGSDFPVEVRARIRAHVGWATRCSREAVDGLFQASGATAARPDVAIQRYQLGIQALANHAAMLPSTNLELYGRILCGLDPPADRL